MIKLIFIGILFLTNIYASNINWSKEDLNHTIKSIKNKKQKIIMAYFWQKDCNACEYMRDRVFENNEVSSFINKNFIPYKTNILTFEYPVFAFPAIYFIGEDGEELTEPIMGARNLDDFMSIIKDIKNQFSK